MLCASFCFSLGGLFIKVIPWNPLAINGVRNLIACVVIGAYIAVTKHRMKFNGTVLVGAICMAGVTTMYAVANKLTTAGNTIILQCTAPIWIVIFVYLFFGTKPNRTALKAYIEGAGGKVAGSVSKATSFLINNDATSTSGKNRKAQELGIPVISEDDFVARFGG